MRSAQDGDRRSYEALLLEVSALVTHFVQGRLRDPHATEEVVQETLLSIHLARHTYDPNRPFGAWMYAIARHRLLDHAKKTGRRRRVEVLDEARADVAVDDRLIEARSVAAFLQRAFDRLTATQQRVIELLKLEERSVAETARRTGLSESAVKVSAHRSYKKLRSLLAEEHE